MSDQEIETAGNGSVVATRPHEQFTEYLARRAEVDGEGRGFEVAANQVDKILVAETEEDIWNADEGGTFNGQDMMDVEIQVNAISFSPSSDEYDAALGVYVLI